MAAIDDFITNARANNLDDETIRQTLEAQGWDNNTVRLALANLTVPSPEATDPVAAAPKSPTSALPSLHPLLAALHHLLLWFFVISSIIAIVGVATSLFGRFVEASALAAMIAVVAVTFTPYAILYALYIRKLRAQPNLIPGKVWSIITICFNSLAALAAAITLVASAIVDGDTSVQVSSALIFVLTAIVLAVYIVAAFVPATTKVRKPILIGYLPVVALLLGILFVMSFLQLGPSLADEKKRKDLVTTVQNIEAHVQADDALPNTTEIKTLLGGPGITYDRQTASSYKLCATFITNSVSEEYSIYSRQGSTSVPISDSYIYESAFERPRGKQCFFIKSDDLDQPYDLPYKIN